MKRNSLLVGLAALFIGGLVLFSDTGKLLQTSVFQTQSNTMILKTNLGDITLKLLRDEAPAIAENFSQIAQSGKYDGTIFHRVIEGFMIQGGDYENSNGTGGEAHNGGYIEDEFSPNLSHVRGAVSMANRGPNTNGSQFFIVHQDATFLDGRHSIFAQVTEGMDVVDKIAGVRTGLNDAPLQPVTILAVELD